MAGIVSTEWLAGRLTRRNHRLLDIRGSFAQYAERHIPSAEYLHVETLRMSRGGVPCQMHSLPVLGAIFGQLGIAWDTTVVLYATDAEDHLNAAYALWSLYVTGNRDVFMLDGHLKKWVAERRQVTQEYPRVAETQYEARFDEEQFADWRYVRDRLGDPDVVLVDSRARSLYTGESGDTVRLGHIPGAVLHNYLWDFNRDGTYHALEAIRGRFERAGVTPDKEVITYCVTGREGSANWFLLKCLLGYPRVRLYQASMLEWAAHPELPLVTGEEPGEVPRRRRRAA